MLNSAFSTVLFSSNFSSKEIFRCLQPTSVTRVVGLQEMSETCGSNSLRMVVLYMYVICNCLMLWCQRRKCDFHLPGINLGQSYACSMWLYVLLCFLDTVPIQQKQDSTQFMPPACLQRMQVRERASVEFEK